MDDLILRPQQSSAVNFDKKRDELVEYFGARLLSLDEKALLYYQGDEPDCIYFIGRGMVKLVKHLANGQERIVRLHSSGSWLGLGRMLNEPCKHTAIAITALEIYQVSVAEMRRLKQNDPASYCQLQEYWFEYLQHADRWITDFSTGALKQRLARLLSYLAELQHSADDGLVTLLSGDEISAVLGSTPESVSRLLAEFKRGDILIATDDESRYRFDPRVLEEIAND